MEAGRSQEVSCWHHVLIRFASLFLNVKRNASIPRHALVSDHKNEDNFSQQMAVSGW